MNYMRADRLIQLIKENYKNMNEEDYLKIENIIKSVAENKIDDIIKRALNKEKCIDNINTEVTPSEVERWRDLTDLAGSILEYVDITKRNFKIKLGEVFETRFIKKELDTNTISDILGYQNSKENDGCYSAEFIDNILYIKFIKTDF